MTFREWTAKKKREEEQENPRPSTSSAPASFREWTNAKYGIVEDDDIAPVVTTTTQPEEEEERKWFQRGLFADGYQFGDITRTILGTGADVKQDILTGGLGIAEGTVDTFASLAPYMMLTNQAMYGYAPLDLETHNRTMEIVEEAVETSNEFIEKDLINEEAIANNILQFDSGTQMAALMDGGVNVLTDSPWKAASEYAEEDMEERSVLGEKADSAVQSGGQLLTTVGLGAMGVPAYIPITMTSYGGEVENALKNGATREEAMLSGAVTAGAEILSEMLFSGISLGLPTLESKFGNVLGRISNRALRTAAKLGVDIVGEGSEEVISQFFSNMGSAIYRDESLREILFSEEAGDEYWESFIGGAVLGGISGGTQALNAAATGADYATGLTNNEQAVVQAEYSQRIAEAEADKGGKLTNKEKNAIYEQVLDDMDKGRISTDTIEQVLGGDTYKAYQDATNKESSLREQETQLTDEIEALLGKENPTLRDSERLAEAREELKRVQDELGALGVDTAKTQLGENVFGLVQNDRLVESYNERGRRSQAFEADLTQYDAKYHATIQNAVDSGILNNTNRTHEFVDMIAKISADKGVPFDFTNNAKLKDSSFALDGAAVNGYVTKDGITLNIDSAKALNSVVGHEITHVLEGTELYAELQTVLFEYAKSKGDYQGRYDALTKLYKDVKDANVDAELTADLVGDYLFSDADFVRSLSVQHRNVFQKLWDEIKYLYKVATAGSKEAKELARVQKLFADVYREGGKQTEGTKYSLTPETDKAYADAVKSRDWETAQKMVDDVANESGYTKVVYHGTEARFTVFDTDEESTNRAEHAWMADYPDGTIFLAESSDVADYYGDRVMNLLLDTSDMKVFEEPDMYAHQAMDDKYGYEVYNYPVIAVKGKDMTIYATLDNTAVKSADTATYDDNGNLIPLSERFKHDNPDIRYSLSDSTGKQLTQEQAEYFKDSKVRDDNGNLKVVYHGTRNADFTVFNRNVNYFTDSREMADSYSPNGDMYEGYVNITKPYEIDAEGEKWSRIPIDESMRKFLQENGSSVFREGGKWRTTPADIAAAIEEAVDNGDMDYDGIIIRNIDDTGSYFKGEGSTLATDYIVFNSNQFKNIDNESPTSDPDIRFSLSETVEETKDLMALHNLTEQKLLKSLKMGGLPMPSVAIAKAQDGHSEFGEISLVLPRETIDPKESRNNKLYSGDAWTPTYPRVEYKANDTVRRTISDKIKSLVPYETIDALGGLHLDADNVSDMLNRNDGDVAEAFKRDIAMQYAYLVDTGSDITLPMKEADLVYYGKVSNAAVRYFAGKLVNGLQTVELYQNMGAKALMQDEALKEAVADAQNWDVLQTLEPGSKEYTEYEQNPVFKADDVSFSEINDFLSGSRKLFNGGIQQTVDYRAAKELIRDTVDQTAYAKWLEQTFSGIVEKEGIRNNKDYFTPSGNRRSFEALHYEHNLENVIKAMREKGEKGIGAFGGGSIFGAATTEFSSVEEMKQSRDRLHKMSEEEYQAMRDEFSNRFFEIAGRLPNDKRSFMATDAAANTLIEAVSKYNTRSGIANYLRRELSGWATYSDQAVDDLIKLVRDIRNMPTGYFEAKPQRAVGFDEVGVFVIPNNADVKLKQELLNRGYAIAEYDPTIEGHRQQVVNQFEEYKFSLSNVGEEFTPRSRFDTFGRDIMKQEAPVQDATVAENATDEDLFPDDLAPMPEDENTAQERLASLDDADAPPEAEAPYTDTGEVTVDDPFAEREYSEIGNRKVKAYMYENPEVKPFFQEEARGMLYDLRNSTRGEKWYNDAVYYETGGERGWGGTKRHTTDDIAYLLDGGDSYEAIEKGLNAIIDDNGAENNAVSKRIEFALNDRLMYGYRDVEGRQIPANEDYINLLNEKQITEYSKEAFDAFMANADTYAPPAEEAAEDIAPVAPTQEAYEAIRPKPQKEPRMARATPAEEARASVLVEEPKAEKKKNGAWSKIKNLVLDKGMVFEDLSLKTGNRELQARWNSIRYAAGKAQNLIGKGNAEVSSLNSIRETVESSGKTQKFYEYLYHLHNADRMSLETRYEDVENKPVFGESVTAEISKATAAELETANPEFKQWAKEVYDYTNYLRGMLVDGGVISDETAKLWADMYPHYVPIRRLGDEGLNINVPLDTGRTGVNAPIKRAKGGSRDILPLFDTMGQRTLQTYKAIAKNRFGVELKNTLGTTIDNEALGLDELIDSIDTQDGLLQEGKNGRKPTFTVFENGEKVTFEITDEMYDALKPASDALSGTSKVLNAVSNVRRGVLTEYNPWFLLKNAVKDVQDVLINSQHAGKTYAAIPKAIKQMATNGHWYAEYMENGGADNTYFDSDTNTFEQENATLARLKKLTGLEAISKANNIIERLPRLAEYIASREAGRSVDVAMLDAARVTTNFAAGGDLTKLLNRNGATFLNASVQGAMQQARNIREAKANGLKGALGLAAKFAVAGIPALILNNLIWDDDEEYEELSDYVKQNYYIVGKFGDGKFVRIPKGRTVAVIQNGLEQMQNLITGDDDVDMLTFLDLLLTNLAPNNPFDNNILSPIRDVAKNETWYGEDLVPTRLQDLPAAEQYDESTDAISRWLGETFNVSPYKVNYLLDQYGGVVSDTFLPMLTPEAESGDDSFLGNMIAPLKDMFTTDSVMKNQNVSDFYTKKDELTVNANASGATDEDVLMSKYMNSVNAEMAELYAQKREIQNSNIPDAMKYEQVRSIQRQIDELAENALNTYEGISYEDDYREGGVYARVGDKVFTQNDEGEWQKLSDEQLTKYEVTRAAGDAAYATDGTNHYRWYVPGEDAAFDAEAGWRKITDKQLERQGEVTRGLGISPEEYWENKEEYDYAYEYPENYAVARAAGGYASFRDYSSALYDIKADKDEYGKSISGSRKEKVIDWLNELDADYGVKLILFKNEYNADDTYNYEIIEYLNSREDLSYEDIVTILKELGFTVSGDGYVTW